MRTQYPEPDSIIPGTHYRYMCALEPNAQGRPRGLFICALCEFPEPVARLLSVVRAGRGKACRKCAGRKRYAEGRVPHLNRMSPLKLQRRWDALTVEQKRLVVKILKNRRTPEGRPMHLVDMSDDMRHSYLAEAIQCVLQEAEWMTPRTHHIVQHRSYVNMIYSNREII